MTHQQKIFAFYVVLSMVIALVLGACGVAERSGDIAPVNDSAPPPTTVASESASEMPPTAETGEQLPADPAAAMVEFTISGGFAGFCDSLTVKVAGDYVLQSCNQKQAVASSLEQADLEILQTWYNQLAAFESTSEDNPGGPDNLTTTLKFNGVGATQADEAQQQVIVDWVNGLFIRLWPQAVEAPPTPTPTEIGSDGLCPEIERPAMIIADFSNPGTITLMDPNTLAVCNVTLDQPPAGRVMAAAGNIYYPVFDPDTQTMTIWQLGANGEETPLAFTAVNMEQVGPFTFAVSEDGAKIAWARTGINADVDPPLYRNDFWTANIDGSNQAVLMSQLENSQKQFIIPIRFSPDNSELFYAMQPDGLGFDFSGRFDSVYVMPVMGGEGQLIFACPTAENPICIGDISSDGQALAYTARDTGEVRVLSRDGNQLAVLPTPATDFVGSAIFGPAGNLAFVSATFAQAGEGAPPVPNPGYISFVAPPYTAQPQTLLADNTVVTLWEWLDDNRLAYGSLDEVGNIGTSMVTLEGQVTELSPNYALAVLR